MSRPLSVSSAIKVRVVRETDGGRVRWRGYGLHRTRAAAERSVREHFIRVYRRGTYRITDVKVTIHDPHGGAGASAGVVTQAVAERDARLLLGRRRVG